MSQRFSLSLALLCLLSAAAFAQNVRQAQFLSTNSPGTTSIAAFKGFAGQPILASTGNSQSQVAFATGWVRIIRQLTVQTQVGVEQPELVPFEFSLEQNYPNPFNPTTVIPFTLDKQAQSHLAVFNVLGQEIRRFDLSALVAGQYEIVWDGKNSFGKSVPSGQYFARLSHDSRMHVRKLSLLK